MSLGDLTSLIGLLAAALALLNEHDRRIWLAPWRGWWKLGLVPVGVLLYLLTYRVWAGLDRKILEIPLVSQSLQGVFEHHGWVLKPKDWASLLFLFLISGVAAWTYLSPLRLDETLRIMDERRISSDFSYIAGKIRGLLSSSSAFRRRIRQDLPKFFVEPGMLHYWLENDQRIIVELLQIVGTPKGAPFAMATMEALASHRTKTIDGALWNFYEDVPKDQLEAALFLELGKFASGEFWGALQEKVIEKRAGGNRLGSANSVRDLTDREVLDTYAGRLCLSWLWLSRFSAITPRFSEYSLEGYSGTALSRILEDLDGTLPPNTPDRDHANRLLGTAQDLGAGPVIDPFRRTPGGHLRTANVVARWFLDEWVERIKRASTEADPKQAIEGLFHLLSMVSESSNLDIQERRALCTQAVNHLCVLEFPDTTLNAALARFPNSWKNALGPWIHADDYLDFGHSGNETYWGHLEALRQIFPDPGAQEA